MYQSWHNLSSLYVTFFFLGGAVLIGLRRFLLDLNVLFLERERERERERSVTVYKIRTG